MSYWDEMIKGLKSGAEDVAGRAKERVTDFTASSMQALERAELRTERKKVVSRIGELVVTRFVQDQRKTIRADAADVVDLLNQLAKIDARIGELDPAAG